MPTRNGKVANLPAAIREQLNLRLLEGESGRELAAWLNALPEVQSILGTQFNGAPVSEVNLTHWRQGGYLQWLTERECFDSARALAEGDGDLASTGLSAERLLNVLTVRYGQILMQWDFSPDASVAENVESGDGGMLGAVAWKESHFAQIAKKARILQGISRSVLAIHRIQSQSALKKSASATTCRAEAAKRVGGSANSHASSEQTAHPVPATKEHSAERKQTGQTRDARMPISYAKGKSANEQEAPRNGTIFSPTGRSAHPKILSGPIMPSDLSHTSFKLDHDLEEILNAV